MRTRVPGCPTQRASSGCARAIDDPGADAHTDAEAACVTERVVKLYAGR
jgi:hypothetical protein